MTALGPAFLLLQTGGAIPTSPAQLIVASSTLTKVVLLVLVVLSLVSWGVMFAASRALTRARVAGVAFQRDFETSRSMEEVGTLVRHATPSAFTRLFSRAVQFVSDTQGLNLQARERDAVRASGGFTAPAAATLTGSQIERLHLILDSEASAERDRLGRYLPWLASIASVSPLIGLLGTVLGVIEAFVGIATKGSGNLSAVAPGVAEALIATAASLAVAIPATFGYNILANRLNRVDAQMESFSTSLIALLVREGHI